MPSRSSGPRGDPLQLGGARAVPPPLIISCRTRRPSGLLLLWLPHCSLDTGSPVLYSSLLTGCILCECNPPHILSRFCCSAHPSALPVFAFHAVLQNMFHASSLSIASFATASSGHLIPCSRANRTHVSIPTPSSLLNGGHSVAALRRPISSLWAIHLTGVRDVAPATDHPRGPGRGLPGAQSRRRPQTGARPAPHCRRRASPTPPPVPVPPADGVACRSRPARGSNGIGNSGYMDTPGLLYSVLFILVLCYCASLTLFIVCFPFSPVPRANPADGPPAGPVLGDGLHVHRFVQERTGQDLAGGR